MVNYAEEQTKDSVIQRAIWQIRTLYAAIKNNPLARENDTRLEVIRSIREKHKL